MPIADWVDILIQSEVFSFLRKFKENNGLWCKLWYENIPEVDAPYTKKRLTLSLHDYDYILEGYHCRRNEEQYQYNVLTNIQIALQLMREKDIPQTFAECAEAVKRFEGKVIMEDVAKKFHDQYTNSKKDRNSEASHSSYYRVVSCFDKSLFSCIFVFRTNLFDKEFPS